MIARVHSHQEHTVRSLFHQGLIKLLIVFHLKKKGKTWKEFLFESRFDAEKETLNADNQTEQDETLDNDNQIEQEETLNADNDGLTEKWSHVNDELSEACVVNPVKDLKGKAMDSSVRPRTRLRRKIEIEAGPNLTENSELIVIEKSISNDKAQPINEEQVSESEAFVELQGRAEHIPEIFCTGKQNYDKEEIDTGLAFVQKEDSMVDKDESDLIPELTKIRKFLISYKKQNEYLHELNENLMLS